MSQIMTKVGPISSEVLDMAILELVRELQPVSFDELERNIKDTLNLSWRTEIRFSVTRLIKNGEIDYDRLGKLEIV